MIHNLFALRGSSLNEAIPESSKSVSYCKISDVVDLLLQPHMKVAFLSKIDLKDAFRMIPIHKSDWHFLGIKVDNLYYIDTVLPMGCGTSCAIFQRITRSLCWLAMKKIPEVSVFGYLDDFLLVSKDKRSADKHLEAFIRICEDLRMPIAEEKTVGPVQSLFS